MGYRELCISLLVIGVATAQNFKVCVPSSDPVTCQNLFLDGSEVSCVSIDSRLDCAIKMASGEADLGSFSEEELLLLSQTQPNDHRIIATIRDAKKSAIPYAFQAVAVVPNTHSGGVEGLKGGSYCHPGLDTPDMRWSPRVLKTLEVMAARTDRCPGAETAHKTAEELEVETLSQFFTNACRPGPWSFNTTVDADLKRRFPNLCSLCGGGTCTGYDTSLSVNIAGVGNNRHIQALECLLGNGTVAYVAWQHVQEFFMTARPQSAERYSLLCPDGTLVPLTTEVLGNNVAPCAMVNQPWRAIVASANTAESISSKLSSWWPNGVEPIGNSWQSTLYQNLVSGSNFLIVQEELMTPHNYTNQIRPLDKFENSVSCFPSVRWCTISEPETTKCGWLAASAYILGIKPTISCERRPNVFQCLEDIRERRADFFSVDSHYGYLARQHYRLSPVKLVQNLPSAASRVAAFVKETAAQSNVTRFENLRDKVACFPEYGGIAYVSFLRTAHERQVISASECDYARAVGEFFSGACAPGAMDATHALSDDSSFNSTILCTACQPSQPQTNNQFICTYDYTNKFYGNNGSVACLADPSTDVAIVQMLNLQAHFDSLKLNASLYRALCRNNTLAAYPGINIDDDCLLSYVVDAEVLTRRNDPVKNAVNTFFDSINNYFGYAIAQSMQLINLRIFSPFNGHKDLLFKDSTIGLTEPTSDTQHTPAKNYIELFRHLEACTGAAAPVPDFASRIAFSFVSLIIMSLLSGIILN